MSTLFENWQCAKDVVWAYVPFGLFAKTQP